MSNKESAANMRKSPTIVPGWPSSQTPCGVKEEKWRHAKIAATTMTRLFRL